MKYFIFNKSTDYERGFFRGCIYDGKSVRLLPGFESGSYISRLLDSRERGTRWHRIVMEADALGDASLQFTFYASDDEQTVFKGRKWKIQDLIAEPDLTSEEKREAFAPYRVRLELNPADALLYDVRGQYLWFWAELLGQGSETPEIRTVRIDFPMESWSKYLPAVYRQDPASQDFLERYLGVFQSVYQDMEREIRISASYLDLGTENEEFLRWMAGWIGLPDIHLWQGDKLRLLLEEAVPLFVQRGTRRGFLRFLTLYFGEKPILVENFELEKYRNEGEKGKQMSRLYNLDEGSAALLIPEQYLSSPQEYQTVIRLIKDTAPAHLQVVIIPLKSILYLGNHSYLGINSRLGHYRPLRLDGRSRLPFTAITGTQGGET